MRYRRVPSVFFTQRHCATQGEFFYGLIMPRSKSFVVSPRIMWRSSDEILRCFLAATVHDSGFRSKVSSLPIHAGTRFGSDRKRPTVMYSRRAFISCRFSFEPSWPRLMYFTWNSGEDSVVVAVGGADLRDSGMHGSIVDEHSSNRDWNVVVRQSKGVSYDTNKRGRQYGQTVSCSN